MKLKDVFFLVAAVCLAACKGDKVPGYKSAGKGIYYKLITLGEGEQYPKVGEYLEMQIYNTFNDSVIYDSHLESSTGTMITPFNEGQGFSHLHEGDSAIFLIPAYDLMPFGNDTLMKMRVKLIHILNEKQYQAEMLRRSKQDEMDEQKILAYFIHHAKSKFIADPSGLYYQELKPGSGEAVQKGSRVLVNYSGYFLNGKRFDGCKEPVEFTLGDEGQLLKGMTLALEKMKQGGKTKFIIPSQLAYGAEGSTTGIVKPFTSLVYEIELIKVN